MTKKNQKSSFKVSQSSLFTEKFSFSAMILPVDFDAFLFLAVKIRLKKAEFRESTERMSTEL